VSNSRLALTEEHRDLAESAFGALSRVKCLAAARAMLDGAAPSDPEIWRVAAELGWHGMAIAEEHGGSGFGMAELVIILEAQGHQLCPGPLCACHPTVELRSPRATGSADRSLTGDFW
jgi:alkylation response protein AidB-like acyl-CoA dehydrogenase